MNTNSNRPVAPLFLSLALISLAAQTPGAEPANPDSSPLKDNSSKANEEARRVQDQAKPAGTDVRKVEDSNPQKASPDARRNRDSSKMADPDAAKVTDSTDDKASPYSRETSTAERLRNADPAPGELPGPEEEETEAELAVKQAAQAAVQAADERKLALEGQGDAGTLVQEILGQESPLSRAEAVRAGQSEGRRVIRADRSAAVDFLKMRLKGEADLAQAPAFFQRRDVQGPLVEGRRFLHFDSSDDIPAILWANAKLERVRIQTAEDAGLNEGLSEPPEEYRGTGARFLSYSLVEGSAVASHDFRFNRNSTQFSDGHSYDMVLAVADALKDPDLAGSRFAVESHVAGPGTEADHREIAQLRAEAIARELVRAGVAPLSLIPVGYGKGEQAPREAQPAAPRSGETRVVIARIAEPKLSPVPVK